MPSGVDRLVAALADLQHHVVARNQLLDLGLTREAIQVRIDRGWLHPIHRGVYAVGTQRLSLRGRWMAAVLAAGPLAVLSHLCAACFWRMITSFPKRIEVTVPHGVRARGDFILHRTRSLPDEEWVVHDGIRVTTPVRTIIDLCSVLPLNDLELAIEQGIRDELFDVDVLRAARLRHSGKRGLGKLDTLIGTAADAAETRSRLEVRLRRFCRKHDLPMPEVNAELCGYEVDGLYRDAHVVLEADSFEFHSSRAAFERDRRRDTALAAAGYTVVRITSRRMSDDGPRLAAEIRRLLSRRRFS